MEDKKAMIRKEIGTWGDMKTDDIGPQVRSLRKVLAKLGYLKEKDTAIY